MKATAFAVALARSSMGPSRSFMTAQGARAFRTAGSRGTVARASPAVARSRLALQKRMSSSAPKAEVPPAMEERYAPAIRYLHWIMAAGLLTCVGTVLAAQQVKGERKGQLMNIHKSCGLLMAGAIVPRVAIRLVTKAPSSVPGPAWQALAGKLSHGVLYAMMIILPGTGIAMGYFGGKGLPFFGYKIPGAAEPNGAIAKQAFKVHKLTGQALEYMIPVHIGAVGFHAMRGHNIMRRVGMF